MNQKWYEQEGKDTDVVVASRVRLSRNLASYPFPDTMEDGNRQKLCDELEEALQGLSTVTGHPYNSCHLNKMADLQKAALVEQTIINKGTIGRRNPMSLLLNDDESVSIILNGDDHIRFQVSVPGNNLIGAWHRADRLDDYVNEKYEYAFDEQYGYLTTFPTNMGTGMKCYQLLHLPMVAAQGRLSSMLPDLTRFGISLKGVVGSGNENYGDLFVAFNQSTLGQAEESRIRMLEKVCSQLIKQERRLRNTSMEQHKQERVDQAYKAYGLLKYARLLTVKDALEYLSMLRMGVFDDCIRVEHPAAIYGLMLSVLPNQIRYRADGDTSEETANRLRADYIRAHLPELTE